jgi:D-alanyl-D-alanine carboxypeptidase
MADQRILFAQNEQESLPLASVTKLMTALVATELLPPGAVATITPEDIREEGDSGLQVGEVWDAGALTSFMLVGSSNDAAVTLARTAGDALAGSRFDRGTSTDSLIAYMNERAREIGLRSTMFRSPSGLDLSLTLSGGDGSARDMAMLAAYIIRKHPDILRPTASEQYDITSLSGWPHVVKNTNREVTAIPGLLASKTGFTDLAGGNLIIAVDIGIGHPIVISVLGSSRDGRFIDAKELLMAVIAETESN